MINERQSDRLVSLISATDGKVVAGGWFGLLDPAGSNRQILEPATDPVMTDEIFGPIPGRSSPSRLRRRCVRQRPAEALALYRAPPPQQQGRELIDRMPSAMRVINHIARTAPQLPSGGWGASGMGAYHGKWGFDSSATGGPCWRSRTSRFLSLDVPAPTPTGRSRSCKLMFIEEALQQTRLNRRAVLNGQQRCR